MPAPGSPSCWTLVRPAGRGCPGALVLVSRGIPGVPGGWGFHFTSVLASLFCGRTGQAARILLRFMRALETGVRTEYGGKVQNFYVLEALTRARWRPPSLKWGSSFMRKHIEPAQALHPRFLSSVPRWCAVPVQCAPLCSASFVFRSSLSF